MRRRRIVWLAIALLLSARAPARAEPVVRFLGKEPICEASGIAFRPCTADGGRCVLIADNERKDELYRFDVEGELLTNPRAVRLETPDGAGASIKDAEGLAVLGEQLIVVGSHSRRSWDKRCTLDEGRLVHAAFARTHAGADALVGVPVRITLDEWKRALAERGSCFLAPGPAGMALGERVCRAMIDGQPHAEESAEACAAGVNFEGVAAVPGTGRVWLGLRGPTVGGRAALLRLARVGSVGFDAVATVDLGGDGVRDLFAAGEWLWVLAGPSADLMQNGSLWRVRLADVVDGAELQPTRVVDGLPPFSEGFAIDPETGGAFVVVDGDEGDGPECAVPARYLYLAPSLLD